MLCYKYAFLLYLQFYFLIYQIFNNKVVRKKLSEEKENGNLKGMVTKVEREEDEEGKT